MRCTLVAEGGASHEGSALVLHNERLVDPLDQIAREIAAITSRRRKTEADHWEIARLEFFGGLYTDPVLPSAAPEYIDGQRPVVPAWNVLRCLQDAAKRHKRGADVLRGVHPRAEFTYIEYDGPSGCGQLWEDGRWSLRKTVGIQRSRMMRTRPMFPEWGFRLQVEVDALIFDLDSVKQIWREAGIYAGLAEMRPVFGRFAGSIRDVEGPTRPDEVETLKPLAETRS